MTTLHRGAVDLISKVTKTKGFRVDKASNGTYKVVGPDGHTTTLYEHPGSDTALRNQVTRLRRIGWSVQLYEDQLEADRKSRIAAADRRHEADYGALLAQAEAVVQNVAPVEMPGGITMTPEVVTPEKAMDYLTRNRSDVDHTGTHRQRRLSKRLITQLAQAMVRGEWLFTHQGIAFDQDGYLLDGQHRLEAVLDSEVPIPIAVWRGMSPDNFKVLDSGKRRNLADILHIEGEAHSTLLGATLRILYLWENVAQMQWPDYYISPDQMLETLEKHPAVRNSMSYGTKLTKLGMVPTAGAAGHYLIVQVWPEAPVDEFWHKLTRGWGPGIVEGDPGLKLRNYLLTQKGRRTTLQTSKRNMKTIFHLSLLIRAWNHDCEGKTIKNITWKEPIRVPDPFVPRALR